MLVDSRLSLAVITRSTRFIVNSKKNGVDYRDFFYWAFFPYNVGKRACIGGVIKKRCAGQCHWIASHVGDWEHVTVRLKNNLPYAMYISANDFGGQYNYDNYRGTFIKGN